MRPEVPKTLAEKVDPRRAALVIVDIQNDFCANGGVMSQRGADLAFTQEMVPRLERFIEEARKVRLPIIFIQLIHDEPYASAAWEEHKLRTGKPVDNCLPGTWGAEFYRLKPQPGDVIVQKHRYSAFVGTNLKLILQSMGVDTVILSGVGTPVCVESTARDAFQYDYYVVMLEDCTATTTRELHLRSLETIGRHFGHVVSSADVFAAWEESGAYARVRTTG